jgi:hypothetical protein
MGMLPDGSAVISYRAEKVKLIGFSTSAGTRGATKVRFELEVTDPWELADLVRSLAEIREHSVSTRAPRPTR